MKIFKVNGAGFPEPRFKTRRARKAWRRKSKAIYCKGWIGIKVTAINPGQNFVIKGYETWPDVNVVAVVK